jgi:hypothetical protein
MGKYRNCYFPSMHDMYRGSSDDLAFEYLNVRNAPDHEFSTNKDRDNYAELVRAVGVFCYGERFLEKISEPEREKPKCTYYSSTRGNTYNLYSPMSGDAELKIGIVRKGEESFLTIPIVKYSGMRETLNSFFDFVERHIKGV